MRNRVSTPSFIVSTAVLVLTISSIALGQGSAPQRGFHPGGSYVMSDIETINTNVLQGNLMLNFPLAKLPPGRNGLTAGISLRYDSKLYDSQIEFYEDFEYGTPPDPVIVERNVLVPSAQGGWHYGMGYELQLIDRMFQYQTTPAYPDMKPIYRWKVRMVFPDGSVHEFLPRGFGAQAEGDGYYNFRPDGWQAVWTNAPNWTPDTIQGLSGATHYYTFDGSYLRLDVEHDSNNIWWDNPWTLTFPDGTTVSQGPTQPQRITDRNGNYIELVGITHNGHASVALRDQQDRQIIIEPGTGNFDIIHNLGFGGADLAYEVHWKLLQVGGKEYQTVEPTTGPNPNGYPSFLGTLLAVSEIRLPSQSGALKYTFGYNAQDYESVPWGTPSVGLGELSSISFLANSVQQYNVSYSYFLDNQFGETEQFIWYNLLKNLVTRKTLTYNEVNDGTASPVTEITNFYVGALTTPDGGNIFQATDPQRVYSTQTADGTIVERVWAANTPQGFPVAHQTDPWTGINTYDPARANGFVKWEITSIRDQSNNLVKSAIKEFAQDKNGNTTSVTEYDWVPYGDVPRDPSSGAVTGIPTSAVKKRVTSNTMAKSTPNSTDTSSNDVDSYWNHGSPDFKRAISLIDIGNGTTTLSRTELVYDNAGSTANLTQQHVWDSTKGALSNPLTPSNSISTSSTYDEHGNVLSATDARGTQTSFTYGAINGFLKLYPTQAVVASNFPSIARTTTSVYDFSSGLVTRSTDEDNDVSTVTSYDAFGRPTLVKVAEGTDRETRTATEYSDVLRRVIVKSDLSELGDGKLVTIQHYDPLGRVRLTRQLEDSTAQSATDETAGIKTQTRYRIHNPCAPDYESSCLTTNAATMGSYTLVSNPYRATSSSAASSEQTMGWTRSRKDRAGRTVAVQTFGSASAPFPWGSSTVSTGIISTSYDANFTTVTDPAGKMRRSMVDGLGRMLRVDEPDSNNALGSTTSPNQPTSYTYDALGNLLTVDQNTSVQAARTFAYSSLSRLTSVFNPESGTTSYKYDANGNLLVKTDARTDPNDSSKKVSTHYEYDALNRITRRWYNGSNVVTSTTHNSPSLPAGVGATDEAKFYYDSALVTSGAPTYSAGVAKGRLVAVIHGSGTNGDYYAYDELGRQTLKIQQTGSVNYEVRATYNLSGTISTITYPSNHTVSYSYDGVGRTSSFSGTLGDGSNRTYATGITYGSGGQRKQEQFGTGIPVYNKLSYNSRQQPAEILVSTTGGDDSWNRGKIVNDYSLQCSGAGCNATDNNGNMRKQTVYIPADPSPTSWYQQYDYDELNRLKRVHEYTGNTELDWQQEYLYDRWGNRRIDTDEEKTYPTGINNTSFEKDDATNRLYAPGDLALAMNARRIQYDAVGNQRKDTFTGYGEAIFDAENRITAIQDKFAGWSNYAYNAAGHRTRRTIQNQETWQVYGIGGELLAEYPASGAASSPQKEYGYRNGELLITAGAAPAQSSPAQLVQSGVNLAAASNGAVATASSTFSTVVPGKVNNGDHVGTASWWADDTSNAYPDWVQVEFNGWKTLSEIDVFGLQQNHGSPVEPTLTMTSSYALTNFEVQYWNGSDWATVPGGSVSGNDKVWKRFTFAPLTTTKIRVHVTHVAGDNRSQVVEIEAYGPINLAAAANGAVATASSTFSTVVPGKVNNGDHVGTAGWWADDTSSVYPDWVQVEFAGSTTLAEIDVFGLQQNFSSPVEPTLTMTSSYALTNFEVQYWNGSDWATVPGASVTGNDKVWRRFTFAPLTTTKIRVHVTNVAGDNRSQVVEIEAYGPANVASAANGAVATASSTFSTVVPGKVNNGDHVGTASWWADDTSNAYPDWIQVEFAGSKTIGEIDVFGLQQNPGSPVEPTLTMTSSYALTNFEVQYWDGGDWATVPGGSVSGNDKVWKKFTFTPLTTTKIRVHVTNVAGDNRSQVVEIEAYAASSQTSVQWLVTDHVGTPRMILDQTGTLGGVKRHDYLPFGEELFALTGKRTAAQGYATGDGVRQQFTSKERDNETQLDFSAARYYASIQGRFASPDPLLSSGRLTQPQSWNRYSYVINKPLKLVDPTGLDWGFYQWTEGGVLHTTYHWFDGKVGSYQGRNYTPVSFGASGYLDINADDGSTVRISNRGIIRQVVYAPPTLTGTGGDGGETLSIGAGLANSAVRALASLAPTGQVNGIPVGLIAEHSFEGMAGVDPDSNAYANGQAIGTGLIFAGMTRLPAIPRITNPQYIKWTKRLAFDEFEATLLAGGGNPIAGPGTGKVLRDAPRLAAEYGGKADDWVKVSSESFKAADGSVIAAHAYRNITNGKVVEMKGVIDKYPFK